MLFSATILVLIAQLGSESFPQRERAHLALQGMLPLAAPYLHKARKSSDVEIQVRSFDLLQHWYFSTAESKAASIRPDNYREHPWIDGLPMDGFANDEDRQATIQHYYKLAEGDSHGPNWEKWRRATKLYLVDQFRSGRTIAEMKAILNKMKAAELKWYADNSGRRSVPAVSPHLILANPVK